MAILRLIFSKDNRKQPGKRKSEAGKTSHLGDTIPVVLQPLGRFSSSLTATCHVSVGFVCRILVFPGKHILSIILCPTIVAAKRRITLRRYPSIWSAGWDINSFNPDFLTQTITLSLNISQKHYNHHVFPRILRAYPDWSPRRWHLASRRCWNGQWRGKDSRRAQARR